MLFQHLNGENFLIPKLTMTICGIWPSDEPKVGASIVLLIWSALKILYLMTQLMNRSESVYLGVSPMGILSWTICSFLSELSIRMNSGPISRLIKSKMDNRWSVTNEKDVEIIKSHRIFGTSSFVLLIPVYFFIPYLLEIIFFFNGTKVEESENQPRSIKNYDPWMIMTSILRIVLDYHNSIAEYGTLMLFWSLNMYLSKEFKILKWRFQQFLRIKSREMSNQVFRLLVDRHNHLLHLSQEFKASFFVFLAIEIWGLQIWICDQAYQLAIGVNNGNFAESFATSPNIAVALWMLFILYNSGDFLTECSEEIADVFYQCKWYNFPGKSINNFAIIVPQCRKPVILKVGGFFKLNHANYKHVIQTVYSYISFILAMTKKN